MLIEVDIGIVVIVDIFVTGVELVCEQDSI